MCIQDVSKKKWILTGTVGSGGFGLIYFAEEQVARPLLTFKELIIFHSLLANKFNQTIQGEKGRKCVVKIEPHENGPLFVEWHYYLAAGRLSRLFQPLIVQGQFKQLIFRPEHLKAWSGPAHLPALWGYGSHTVGDEKLR